METIDELKTLANIFKENGYTLYIVGGFVRDKLLGYPNTDIDITSNMPCDDVINICNQHGFSCKEINKVLGTLLITINGKQMEYTRFRKESYTKTQTHTPDEIEFVDNIESDSLRRDLTINAIYFDILEEKYIDPVGGLNDIKAKTIRTANTPLATLKDDGLRILRTIRFASALGFKIERKTRNALALYKPNLNRISKERIQKELKEILLAQYKYGNENEIGLNQINKLGLLPYIFNSRLRDVKLSKKQIRDIYSLSKDSRIIGFYFVILKNYLKTFTKDSGLMFACNMLLGRDGIKESKDNIAITEKIFRIYQNLKVEKESFTASLNYLTLSFAEREIIDKFVDFDTKCILNDNIKYIKDKNLPLSIHDLPVKAVDLIEANIENKYISKILTTLYNLVLGMKVKNTKGDLLNKAKEINETFINISKDAHK